MKNHARVVMIIAMFFLVLSAIAAETVDLVLVTADGKEVTRSVDADITRMTIANRENTGYRISSVKNLDKLIRLETLEMYYLSDVQDYSFLRDVPNLKFLHIGGCYVTSLKFVEELQSLTYVYLDVLFQANDVEKIRQETVDFSRLTHLEFVAFRSHRYIGVPKFINVRNKPFIDLMNNNIEKITKDDKQLLRQYSLIDLRFNPIEKDAAELRAVSDLPKVYGKKELPERIRKYY